MIVCILFGPWENEMKWHEIGPGCSSFPANSDLADVLDDMNLDFDNFHCEYFLDSEFLDFQVPRIPKSGPGRAWAGLEPSGPKYVDFLLKIFVSELPAAYLV